jgi:hypothetical protein
VPVSVNISGPTPPSPDRIREIVLEEAEDAMRQATAALQREWVSVVPKRTSHLARSITTNVTRIGDRIIGEVGTTVKYAAYLEFGTGLYGPKRQVIRPKRARALRFPDPSQGFGRPDTPFTAAGRRRSGQAGADARYVYARYVRGIQPRHYGERSAEAVKGLALGFFRAAGRRAAMRIAGGA